MDHEMGLPSVSYGSIDKADLTKLLIQSLYDLGHNEIANKLERESNLTIESPKVKDFKSAVLEGKWELVEELLTDLPLSQESSENSSEVRNRLVFLIRKQHFMELLEEGQTQRAVRLLRTKITCLNPELAMAHNLSVLVMVPDDQIANHWSGRESGRAALLKEILKCLSPSVVLPPHRLTTLIDQAHQYQIMTYDYWMGVEGTNDGSNRERNGNSAKGLSLANGLSATNGASHGEEIADASQGTIPLFRDVSSYPKSFPNLTSQVLAHDSEVWCIAFSPDGTKLTVGCKDGAIYLYHSQGTGTQQTFSLEAKTLLSQETDVVKDANYGVLCLEWSPDGNFILVGSEDRVVRLYDPKLTRLFSFKDHHSDILAVGWLPDSQTFISASPDKRMYMWNTRGEQIFKFPAVVRHVGLAISPDGKQMVVACEEKTLHFYDLKARMRVSKLCLKRKITSLQYSKDSSSVLVSIDGEEIFIMDAQTKLITRKYVGKYQEYYMIRSCFGGRAENFILSGSEDYGVFVWNRHSSRLIQCFSGHTQSVSCVRWSPTNPFLFASGSDDRTVRLWLPIN